VEKLKIQTVYQETIKPLGISYDTELKKYP